MGKPTKTKEELLFTDFMNLKGSRWKAKFGDKVAEYIAETDTLLRDCAGLEFYYCQEFMDSLDFATLTIEAYTGLLYEFYFANEDVIMALIPTLGGDISNATSEMTEITDKYVVETTNPELINIKQKIKNIKEAIKNDIQYLTQRRAELAQLITNDVTNTIRLEKQQEAYELLKTVPKKKHDIGAMHANVVSWCQSNNAICTGAWVNRRRHHRKETEDELLSYCFSIVFRPREMYNPDQPSDKGYYTLPIGIDFRLGVADSHTSIEYIPFERSVYTFDSDSFNTVKHPHITSYVCTGEVEKDLQKYFRSFDVATALDRFDALLRCYNPSSPFCKWDVFKEKGSYNAFLANKAKGEDAAWHLGDFLKMTYSSQLITRRISNAGSKYFEHYTTLEVPEYTISDLIGEEAFNTVIEGSYDNVFYDTCDAYIDKLEKVQTNSDVIATKISKGYNPKHGMLQVYDDAIYYEFYNNGARLAYATKLEPSTDSNTDRVLRHLRQEYMFDVTSKAAEYKLQDKKSDYINIYVANVDGDVTFFDTDISIKEFTQERINKAKESTDETAVS